MDDTFLLDSKVRKEKISLVLQFEAVISRHLPVNPLQERSTSPTRNEKDVGGETGGRHARHTFVATTRRGRCAGLVLGGFRNARINPGSLVQRHRGRRWGTGRGPVCDTKSRNWRHTGGEGDVRGVVGTDRVWVLRPKDEWFTSVSSSPGSSGLWGNGSSSDVGVEESFLRWTPSSRGGPSGRNPGKRVGSPWAKTKEM